MILRAAADVAIIRHLARAQGATSHGVTPATRGHTCAGNATDHGMSSKIAASLSQDAEALVAMVDLSNDTEMMISCNAAEHASADVRPCRRRLWCCSLRRGAAFSDCCRLDQSCQLHLREKKRSAACNCTCEVLVGCIRRKQTTIWMDEEGA